MLSFLLCAQKNCHLSAKQCLQHCTRNEEKASFLYEKSAEQLVKMVRKVWREVFSKRLLKQPKEEPH